MAEGKNEQTATGVAGYLQSSLDGGWFFALLLVAATLLAYLPALRGQFIWDDDSWTTKISGLLLDASGLWTMWSKPGALQQYYPLTGTTFWFDYQLWGFWTLPYHVENVLLHACAALLFWRLLLRLQVPGAWLAAAIFALHPVMVESAGWITERKNVLSLLLYLGALLAYGRFACFWKADNGTASAETTAPSRRWGTYGLALLLFIGADEQKQGQPICPPTARGRSRFCRCGAIIGLPETGEAPVGQQRTEIQKEREHILALGDPAGRFDHHRVKREDRRRQPSPRHLEPQQQSPEEQRGARVKEDVLNMIRQRPETPEMVIEPKGGAGERVILLQRARLGPHRPQTRSIKQQPGDLRGPRVVIPNELSRQRRQVSQECGRHEQQGEEPTPVQRSPQVSRNPNRRLLLVALGLHRRSCCRRNRSHIRELIVSLAHSIRA